MARAGNRRIYRRRRNPRRLFKAVLFVLISGALLAILVYSPLFSVRAIDIQGATRVSQEDILRIAGAYKGAPLFSLATDQMAQNLMKDLRIEQATVRRNFPSTLVIAIKERKPVATFRTDYGYADVDSEGVIIDAHKDLGKQPDVPMVTGLSLGESYIGDKADAPEANLAIQYLNSLSLEAQKSLSEISLLNPKDIVAYALGGAKIYLGALDDPEGKASLTEAFLRDLKEVKRPVAYVDFRTGAPSIRFQGM